MRKLEFIATGWLDEAQPTLQTKLHNRTTSTNYQTKAVSAQNKQEVVFRDDREDRTDWVAPVFSERSETAER